MTERSIEVATASVRAVGLKELLAVATASVRAVGLKDRDAAALRLASCNGFGSGGGVERLLAVATASVRAVGLKDRAAELAGLLRVLQRLRFGRWG